MISYFTKTRHNLRKVFLKSASKLLNMPLYELDEIYSPLEQRPVNRCVLFLPGRGCAWYKQTGGCKMCGFNKELDIVNRFINISPNDFLAIYDIAEERSQFKSPIIMTIYNGGSFLNPQEIPWVVQKEITNRFQKHSTSKLLEVETRPEYVVKDTLKELIYFLKSKQLQVNIGLECVDDYIRDNYINKGFSRKQFETACTILKNTGARVLTYVFLKPPFVGEKQAIEEAINTINYAFNCGSDEVALECATIHKGTDLEKMYNKGEFKPPWLWSILKVVESVYGKGIVRIGGFKDIPKPLAVPKNCDKCTKGILAKFLEYKKDLKIESLKIENCSCKTQWAKESA